MKKVEEILKPTASNDEKSQSQTEEDVNIKDIVADEDKEETDESKEDEESSKEKKRTKHLKEDQMQERNKTKSMKQKTKLQRRTS